MRPAIFILILLYILNIGCKDDEIVFNSECYPENLRSGVIAAYAFNNGSLANNTSSGSDLVLNNSPIPTTDRNGNLNCAFYFNRNLDQYLSTTETSFLNDLKEISISLWYEPFDSSGNGGSLEVLMGRNTSQTRCPDRRGEWSLGLYDCRRPVFGHNNSVWALEFLPIPPASCNDLIYAYTGSWHHVVATYKNETIKIYLNGIFQDSVSGNGSCTNLHLAEDIGDLFIGRSYTGKIDDILLYNREISSSEVLSLYENDPCCQP